METKLTYLVTQLERMADALDNRHEEPQSTLTLALPRDKHQMNCALHGTDLASVLWEISEYLRQEYKYNSQLNADEIAMVEKFREKFNEIINDHCVNFIWEG